MAHLLNLGCLRPFPSKGLTCRLSATSSYQKSNTRACPSLHPQLNSNGRYMCLFSYNRNQDEARKALESALGEDKNESEKWDKETKKRVEVGGRGDVGGRGSFGSGGGGFGSGGSDGWSNGDSFWSGAQQTSFAVFGLIIMVWVHHSA